MNLLTNKLYNEDIEYVASIDLPWKKLYGRTVMLSGATGMIGSFIIDVLMRKNENGLDCTIIALGRTKERIEKEYILLPVKRTETGEIEIDETHSFSDMGYIPDWAFMENYINRMRCGYIFKSIG